MSYFLFLLSLLIPFYSPAADRSLYILEKPGNLADLFSQSPDTIENLFQNQKAESLRKMGEITSLSPQERTYENTVLAYDKAVANFRIAGSLIATLRMVHPSEAMRSKADEILASWNECRIDLFETNQEIYRAFKEYQTKNDLLNEERKNYLSQALLAFTRAGLELDPEGFKEIQKLQKEIASLALQFQTNISQDSSSMRVTKGELAGVDETFIKGLQRDDDRYLLLCDYPTAFQILAHCSVEKTRRAYFQLFHNRAYPQNVEVLQQLVAKRGRLAKLLGYKSYAAFDIAPEMAKTADRVAAFLNETALETDEKVARDWNLLKQKLPPSATLTPEGKIKGWDALYIIHSYIKKQFKMEQNRIAEYFPLDAVIAGLLKTYGQFFNLQFRSVSGQSFWDPSVRLIEVRDAESLIGYVLLDLFPRQNKYTHACCNSIIPPISYDGRTFAPALAVLITNFSKPTDERPSLLNHHELQTLFHEFGHAIHALLGRSEASTKAAYNTTIDFVEAPSQLLEEWVWDPTILKIISSHYKTKNQLPDSMVEGLLKSRGFGDPAYPTSASDGDFLGTSVLLSRLSLGLFQSENSDIEREAYQLSPQIIAYNPDLHFLCSFGHLAGYGAKYYSYLWSKRWAQKIYHFIQEHGGPLDPHMGQHYRDTIIGRGGSVDPEVMLEAFFEEKI